MPPTLEQIAAFEADQSPLYYQRTVQRLIDDPRHGQRWARHWMDVWRYSDWWGLGDQLRNSQQHIWHWRDWIVQSLNEDSPYDEMVRLMLAADELHPGDLDKLPATGFLARNFFLFNRAQWMDETVEHVSKGFLALTMNCTRCHDHKYDPIEQTDYYRMRAFFEPYHVRMDMLPGQSDLNRDGIPRAFDGLPAEPTYLYIRGDEKNPDKSTVIAPGVPALLAFKELSIEPVTLPEQAWRPAQQPWVLDAYIAAAEEKLKAAETGRKQAAGGDPIATAEQSVSQANVDLAVAELTSVQRRAEAMRASWTQIVDPDLLARNKAAVRAERQVAVARAQYDVAVAQLELLRASAEHKEGADKKLQTARQSLDQAIAKAEAEVEPTDTFTPLVGARWTPTRFRDSGKDDPTVPFVAVSTGRRSALADWITDRRNPLTARVAANQIWMRHMGAPLVPTVFDFGRNGTPPANQDLLDYLAAELIDHGWSMKHLHRIIVTSAAYRMGSSLADADAEQQSQHRSRKPSLVAKDADPNRIASRSRFAAGPCRNTGCVIRRFASPARPTVNVKQTQFVLFSLQQ